MHRVLKTLIENPFKTVVGILTGMALCYLINFLYTVIKQLINQKL